MATGSMFYDYNPALGVIIPDTTVIREKVCDIFKTAFGANFVTDNSTPAGVMIDSLTQVFAEQCGIVAQCANGFNINFAVGKWLDGIGTILSITRHPVSATEFSIGVKSTATVGKVYPVKTIVLRDAAGNSYHNIDQFTSAGDVFSTIRFRCSELGVISDNFSSLDVMSFHSEIRINLSSISVLQFGENEESDYSYRERLLKGMSRGIGYTSSVTNAIMAADPSVKSVRIGKNYSCAYVNQDGIIYPPASCCIVIRGAQKYSEIENAIANSVPFGCGFCSDAGTTAHEFSIDGAKGSGYSAWWHEAEPQSVAVSIGVTNINYAGSEEDLQTSIDEFIADYFDSVGLGATITTEELSMFIVNRVGGIKVRYIRFNETLSGWQTSLTLPIGEYPVAETTYDISYQA